MSVSRKWFGKKSQRRQGKKNTTRRPFRRAGIEALEPRQLLSTVPTLAPIDDVTLYSGSPLHIALDAADADGDNLSFSASISNPNMTGGDLGYQLPQGNRSMRISVPDHGDMVFELFEGRVPRATEQIITLAESGFYDGLIFHRVINNFMIQGGCPTGTGSGSSDLLDFDDQFHIDLQHNRTGLLSMAKSTDDTNNSQFFITEGPTRHLDYNHSIFGLLIEGEAVRESISNVPVNGSSPVTPVVMESVEIFYDNENGVLMLSAPEGASGTASVTVTVDDGNGGTASQTFSVTVEPDVTPDLGPNEVESLNANPFLADTDPVYTMVDTGTTFQLAYIDADGPLILTDAGGETEEQPTYFLDEYIQYTYLLSDPNVSGDDVQAFSHADLDYEVNLDTGLVTVTPKNGLVGVHPVSVAVAPWAFTSYYDGYETQYQLKGLDSQLVPVVIQPTGLLPESRLDMSIVQTPTATDAFGEIDQLPENVEWMDEWESFSVEIWASTEDTDEFGIHTAALDLTYNTDYYTAVKIEHGDMFNQDRTGMIDDAAGRVNNIGGRTPMYALTQTPGYYSRDPDSIEKFGDDKPVLVARVNFVPNETGGGVPLVTDDDYPQPVRDLGLAVENAQVGWNVAETTTVLQAAVPSVDVWPMIYDNDDSGKVDLGDLAFFAAAYGTDVGEMPDGLAWKMDYDCSGKVDLGDLAFFAANYRNSATSPGITSYPAGFPEDWLPASPPATAMTMATMTVAPEETASGQILPDDLAAEAQLGFALAQSQQAAQFNRDSSGKTASVVDLLMRTEEF